METSVTQWDTVVICLFSALNINVTKRDVTTEREEGKHKQKDISLYGSVQDVIIN